MKKKEIDELEIPIDELIERLEKAIELLVLAVQDTDLNPKIRADIAFFLFD